ncbi:MAG: hypothetical protein U9P79_03055 [Candidatus Cloacimonadota bacterium]|nr:hypothetical protein [Candidatus Cloacimonadota bacterium]
MKKYALPILILFLIFIAFYFIFISKTSQSPPNLLKVKNGITKVLQNIDSDLKEASQKIAKTGLKSSETSKILLELCKDHPYAMDCVTISPDGIITLIEPAKYKKSEGANISNQPHIIKLKKTEAPLISSAFEAVEGFLAIVFQYPIFTEEHKLAGALSMILNPNIFINEITKPIIQDSPVDVWIMQADGIIIYDPDETEIGRNLFTDKLYQPFKELLEIGNKIIKTEKGVGVYNFFQKGFSKTISKRVYWTSLKYKECDWKIIMTLPVEKNTSAKRTIKDLGIKSL